MKPSFAPRSVQPHAATVTTHLPFQYSNKSAFLKYKLIPFMAISFGIPWLAIGWRWYRPGGMKNP
ncbi:hypothetical protein BDZ89DRAFT_1071268 [Hymenopellis radicata]|nr:hypothetical protein BDZ89DRAFT_1071268 [Hymenopellis radicata]